MSQQSRRHTSHTFVSDKAALLTNSCCPSALRRPHPAPPLQRMGMARREMNQGRLGKPCPSAAVPSAQGPPVSSLAAGRTHLCV